MKIVVVSGGFDPLHSGHIKYFNSAKEYGDKLILLLNSDKWLENKKGKFFMPFQERYSILINLKMIDDVFDFDDDDIGSCCNGLKKIKKLYRRDKIIFCNGGDRNKKNIPELKVDGIDFRFGVGGNNKINSSSWILKDYKYDNEERVWGRFYNLFKDNQVKVKELVVHSKNGMSYQRHFQRNEIWLVSKGKCKVKFSEEDSNEFKFIKLAKHDTFIIKKGNWHQIINDYEEDCHIIEIQYGEETKEEDIERLHYFE